MPPETPELPAIFNSGGVDGGVHRLMRYPSPDLWRILEEKCRGG